MKIIDGKKAIQLNQIILCNPEYWVAEDGTYYTVENITMQVMPYINKMLGPIIIIKDGQNTVEWNVDKLFIRALKRHELWIEEKKPKQWVIGIFPEVGNLDLFNEVIYSDEAEIDKYMKDNIVDYPDCTLIKLGFGDTVTTKTVYEVVWSKA